MDSEVYLVARGTRYRCPVLRLPENPLRDLHAVGVSPAWVRGDGGKDCVSRAPCRHQSYARRPPEEPRKDLYVVGVRPAWIRNVNAVGVGPALNREISGNSGVEKPEGSCTNRST